MKATLFCLLSLLSISFAALTATFSTTAANSLTATSTLTADGSSTTSDALLATALSSTFSVTVTTSVASNVQFNISINTQTSAALNTAVVAGSQGLPTVNFAAALGNAVNALTIGFSASNNAVTTLTVTLPAALIAVSANQNNQFNMLIQTNDFSASGSASSSFYGAVAVSVASNTYTYTIPANTPPLMFLAALNLAAAGSAINSGTFNTGANANGGGSAHINLLGSFIPVAYGANYALTSGVQYAYGKNIQVTPLGVAAGTANNLQVNYNGLLGAGTSAAPSTTNGGYFNGFYQFTGNNNVNNVIQWTSDSSNTAAIYTASNGTAYTNAQVAANTVFTNSVSWYRAAGSAGTATTASAWGKVDSYRSTVAATASVQAKLSVWANVASYSQWTVAASTPNPTGTTTGSASALSAAVATVVAAFVFAL